ncbi:unnamed protein product [Brassica oleracea var. botrytis]
MWVNMLLIDVNSTIMQATVYANRLPRFPSKLAAGKMFSISGFDVARCAQNYRLTDSPLLGLERQPRRVLENHQSNQCLKQIYTIR